MMNICGLSKNLRNAIFPTFLVLCAVTFVYAQKKTTPDELLLASFDVAPDTMGDPVYNEIGGQYGVWNRFPDDATQYCKQSYALDPAVHHGLALQLDYDVDSPNPAYNGFWLKLNGRDFTAYKTLNLYIRGDSRKGYTTRLKVELKDYETTATYMVNGITSQWQKFSIPFTKYWKIKDWSQMNELVIVFDDIFSRPKVGTIYIDHITITKE
jgi:hypothetical protein